MELFKGHCWDPAGLLPSMANMALLITALCRHMCPTPTLILVAITAI